MKPITERPVLRLTEHQTIAAHLDHVGDLALEVVEVPAFEPLEELHMSAEEEFHSSVCEVLMGVERGAGVDVETGGTAPGCPWCDQALPEDPQMEDHLEDCKLAALLWEARHQLKGMRE